MCVRTAGIRSRKGAKSEPARRTVTYLRWSLLTIATQARKLTGVETRLSRELRMRANANVLAMADDDESGWVSALLADIADAPLLRDERGAVFGRRSELTPAELRVIGAMSHGLTAGMAADLFTVSPETIKRQLKGARFRLEAKNTAHAVANALRRGYIR